MMKKQLPIARNKEIVVQNLTDETLIYDLKTNRAFCLNETAAKVFNHCDGKTTFADLKTEHQLTDEIIYLALDELKKENLIEDKYVSPFAEMNRRDVIRKVGLASMIALPLITGLTAPTAANAASGAVVCSAPGVQQCLCSTGSNNNPTNSCGSGSTNFGFALCQAGCSCISPAYVNRTAAVSALVDNG